MIKWLFTMVSSGLVHQAMTPMVRVPTNAPQAARLQRKQRALPAPGYTKQSFTMNISAITDTVVKQSPGEAWRVVAVAPDLSALSCAAVVEGRGGLKVNDARFITMV